MSLAFAFEDTDKFAAISQQRALASTQAGKFKGEIVPVPVKRKEGQSEGMHTEDEGIRPGVTQESVAKLKAMFPNGVLTPASSSQICDGAAAVLICNERGLQKLGLKPMARIHAMALAASDPVVMLEAPIPASQKALEKANLKISDMDIYEVNEAFASVPLAWRKALNADFEKLNVNGGAMALGHPLGGTGAKLMTTLLHELRRRKGRFGLLAICEGGGTANATIVEMLPESKLWPSRVVVQFNVSRSVSGLDHRRRIFPSMEISVRNTFLDFQPASATVPRSFSESDVDLWFGRDPAREPLRDLGKSLKQVESGRSETTAADGKSQDALSEEKDSDAPCTGSDSGSSQVRGLGIRDLVPILCLAAKQDSEPELTRVLWKFQACLGSLSRCSNNDLASSLWAVSSVSSGAC
ncbi:unnamed protein product, partial [Effrenium voratum]